ncbi:MAG TPA: nucleoside hydrolase [Planctomycetaceae bacterium]|nr:nucleoside hydrolase [Planctomycetaceae bacterium]
MAKKIVLDVDPGIVDAMVLPMALFDPEVDVLAITSVGGNVPAHQTARNLQAIVEFLDPPRLPRLGMGAPPDEASPVDVRHVHGIDGLCGTPLPVAELRSRHPAEKVICDAVRSAPEQVSIIALGPLTNIARALQRDPEIELLTRHIHILGGTVEGPGNITAAADFNFYADPKAARQVIQSRMTKTLVPLDVTNTVMLTLGDLDLFPDEGTRLGSLLRAMLPPAFRAYRQAYGLEGIHIHDLVAYLAALHPEWILTKVMACDVETGEGLTRGMTVFDRRPLPQWRKNIDVVVRIHEREILRQIIKELNEVAEKIGE